MSKRHLLSVSAETYDLLQHVARSEGRTAPKQFERIMLDYAKQQGITPPAQSAPSLVVSKKPVNPKVMSEPHEDDDLETILGRCDQDDE
jgi:hypothetical protein